MNYIGCVEFYYVFAIALIQKQSISFLQFKWVTEIHIHPQMCSNIPCSTHLKHALLCLGDRPDCGRQCLQRVGQVAMVISQHGTLTDVFIPVVIHLFCSTTTTAAGGFSRSSNASNRMKSRAMSYTFIWDTYKPTTLVTTPCYMQRESLVTYSVPVECVAG